MKNWLLPIAVLGMSGIGLLCTSERARAQMRNLFDRMADAPDPFGPFNQALERELEYIQHTLDQLSEALEA